MNSSSDKVSRKVDVKDESCVALTHQLGPVAHTKKGRTMFNRSYTVTTDTPDSVVSSLNETLKFHGHTIDHIKADIPVEALLKAVGYWISQGLDVRGIEFYNGITLRLSLESFVEHFAGLPEVTTETVKRQDREQWFIYATYSIDGIQFVTTADNTQRWRRLLGC